MLSLRMKSQNLSQDQLNQKRNQINRQISKLLRKDKNGLKANVDDVKKKISDVLKLFKESLEEKTAKRIKELEEDVEALNRQLRAGGQEREPEKDAREDAGKRSEDLIPSKYISDNLKNHGDQSSQPSANQEEHNRSQDSEDNGILQKLEPQVTNSKGKIVVEVEKVFKDLQVLYHAMRASKFFKLCI